FLAGQIARAPEWMQRRGLEWLFRLGQEPRRLFQRYVKDFWGFGRGLLRQWLLMRPGKETKTTAATRRSIAGQATTRLVLPERLDAAFVARTADIWDSLGNAGQTLLADASGVSFVDSTGVGALIRLRKLLRGKDAELILVGASQALLRGLEIMKLTKLF